MTRSKVGRIINRRRRRRRQIAQLRKALRRAKNPHWRNAQTITKEDLRLAFKGLITHAMQPTSTFWGPRNIVGNYWNTHTP